MTYPAPKQRRGRVRRHQSLGMKLRWVNVTRAAEVGNELVTKIEPVWFYLTDRPDKQPVTALDSLRLRRAEMKRRRKGLARIEQVARTAEGRKPIPLSSWNVVYDYSGSRYCGVRP